MSFIAQRLKAIKPSPTLAITQKAAELKQQGKNIISLGVGEPDFDTPQNIKQAAITAIEQGFTKYTTVDGTLELKQAIQGKFKRENYLDYELNEITVGAGGKQVIYNLFMASLNKGDEVIIPAPYWVSYPDIVLLAEGSPVIIECPIESGFKLTPLQLANNITSQTKWLILNSPSNPTGATYTKAELAALGEVLNQHPHMHILSDDIYEHIMFDEFKFFNLAMTCPQLKDRIFIVNGVSKAYSMTGWRIGYGAGDSKLIKAISILQSQSTTNPSSISQAAAVEALNGTQNFIPIHAKEFGEKRDAALKILGQIKDIKCYKPEGAFYLFIYCKGLMNKALPNGEIIRNCNDLAAFLLEKAEVAVVPGIAFGLENYFRISTATTIEELTTACKRIKQALLSLIN